MWNLLTDDEKQTFKRQAVLDSVLDAEGKPDAQAMALRVLQQQAVVLAAGQDAALKLLRQRKLDKAPKPVLDAVDALPEPQ